MNTKAISFQPLFLFGILASVTLIALAGCSMSHSQAKEQTVGTVIAGTTPAERATALTALMTSTLNLNESQQTRVAALNMDYSTRFSILVASTNPNLDKKAEFMRLSADKEAKLKGMLSDSQIQAYDANKADLLDTYRLM